MSGLDRRTTLARADLAAAGLQGRVRAARFVETIAMALGRPAAAIRSAPDATAEQVDQLLLGEIFDVAEPGEVWSWGQARRDGYVGFVETAALSRALEQPTHTVSAPRTFAFAEPSIKSAAWGPIGLNAFVRIDGARDGLAHAAGVGWIAAGHLRSVGTHADDPAGVAESFLGAPYLWGGRDGLGLDCSGLVQQALHACGRACPRDADQQACLGVAVEAGRLARGDLVFWRGHVAMMGDGAEIVHANAHHMAVAREPLAGAMARIRAAGGGEPTAFRRTGSTPTTASARLTGPPLDARRRLRE